jgi:ankyrin repeat protein
MPWSRAHHAVDRGDLARLRELLDAGADVEDPGGDPGGRTLLHHAVAAEHEAAERTGGPAHADLTAFLLARGADPSAALRAADECGHWLAAEILRAWPARSPA